ncbi:uncharacterized protein LOC105840961 [Monomorium pharaonis]|uniref:uncharacterized protein LOC105840961 n=1 Tax=Monomorium pharaonis TaxID=307658 RepID=UPI001746E7CF|nr:uncharacterized protein LOC105840961 [Monomorium pharaonis]
MARKSTFNRTLKFMLTLCGIWPGTPYVLLCRIFWVVSMAVTLFCHYRYFFTHVHSAEILDLMDCLSTFLAYSKIIFKFFVFWLNQRKFVEILAVMTEDWSDCANSDISMREAARKAKISDRITNAVVTLHTMTIVAYCIGIILADADVTDTTRELPLINKLEIPFDIKTQSMYRIVLITEFLLMILCGWAAGITNSLLLTLILHTAGQIEIMSHWLAQLVPRIKNKDKHKSFATTTGKIIQKHQKIISFSKNIESLYSSIALLQFVSNTIMICSIGFLIVTAIGSPNALEQIMKSFLFFTITNLEAFIFCYAGEYLNNKSNEIGIAAYNCEWYDLKSTESRFLLFIILRSQKQLTLTVGKMMDLSLQTFTSNPLNRMVKFILTLCGVWPGGSSVLFCRILFTVSLTFAQYCNYRYIMIHMHSIAIEDVVTWLTVVLAHCKVFFKCLIFWLNQRKFIEVLTMMQEDWSDCAKNDVCMRETVRKAKMSERITNMLIILHTTSIVSHSMGVFLANVDVTSNTTEILFFTKIDYPFDINTQSTYRFVLVTDFFFLLTCSCSAAITNALLVILRISALNAELIIKNLLFFTITNIEAYIYCYLGEYLRDKSRKIDFAVYSSTWYDMKNKDSSTLLFVLLRSQKQLTLTIGKMMDLSLQTFTSFRLNTIRCKKKKKMAITRKSTFSRIVFLMLPLFGVSSDRLVILITRLFWIAITAFIELCHYLYFTTHLSSENFFNLVDCVCSFLAHAKVFIKLVAFWVNQRKFEETLALITDDWSDYAKNDIGMRVMIGKAKISDRITHIIIILHTINIFAYCLGVIIADADVTETIELPLVNKLELPFSINTQHMYRFVLIVEFIHMILCNWVAGLYNAVLLTLVFHVGGQIDILQCWLAKFIPKDIENKQESIVMTNKFILKHQKIIQFSENIESLYTYIALLLFASNTMLICLLAFIIVTAIGTADAMEQIIKCILFFTTTNVEAFIFCYAGEYLNNKSKEIGFATYNCAWYNLKPKDSRILSFIILRSQKQLTLTAGKMMDLTLQTFASIMNASGSYLSVLLAMQ